MSLVLTNLINVAEIMFYYRMYHAFIRVSYSVSTYGFKSITAMLSAVSLALSNLVCVAGSIRSIIYFLVINIGCTDFTQLTNMCAINVGLSRGSSSPNFRIQEFSMPT